MSSNLCYAQVSSKETILCEKTLTDFFNVDYKLLTERVLKLV